ncbi:hypothetical protein [Fusobacterium russii]|uniref:hypothetical protein n=1 Tax=Fusobacterium russii TaxID=854 RepID=UPI0003A657C4|nr:hypothetical protein [Fusobacterium russii]
MYSIYLTRKVRERLNKYLLEKIISIVKTKKDEADYLQVFKVNGKELINFQEEPKLVKKFKLTCTFKEEITIWAVQGQDKIIGTYWTIMFPDEY